MTTTVDLGLVKTLDGNQLGEHHRFDVPDSDTLVVQATVVEGSEGSLVLSATRSVSGREHVPFSPAKTVSAGGITEIDTSTCLSVTVAVTTAAGAACRVELHALSRDSN